MALDEARWARVKELFAEALERPEAERDAYLEGAAAGNAELRAEVSSLLAVHFGRSDSFLEAGALAAVPGSDEAVATALPGLMIGPYRILSELGRGGMGAVYRAERADGSFAQQVAIKLIKRGMDSEAIVRRFVGERRILAGLVHPHIARLLDGGSTADGRPYFVMELVAGRPITAYAEAEHLGLEERLRLFEKVAAAVQLAHQNLVVHRDLKPANILVGDDGEPKLLDFGIAKLLHPEAGGAETALDERPLTPDYASPEQRAGRPVTTATDVYGLGILLYELLVGKNPASVARRLGDDAGVWAERPPSYAILALAAHGADTAGEPGVSRRLARRLRGDLDAIVTQALAADPARRYGTAAALAEDLARHLSGRPVLARRATLTYRFGRAVKRHKLAAALALAVLLFAGMAGFQAFALARSRDRAEAQRARAEVERRRAESSFGLLLDLFHGADPERARGAALTVREVLDTGARRLLAPAGGPGAEPTVRAELLRVVGEVYSDLGLYREARASLTDAVRLARSGVREEELAAAEAFTQLGHLSREEGDWAGSRARYRQALAVKRKWLGEDALAQSPDYNGLGLIAVAQNELPKANLLFRRAEAIARAAGAGGEDALTESLNNLALLAQEAGRTAEAERLLREALGVDRRRKGEDHPETARGLSNLAAVLLESGDLAQAAEIGRQALDLRRRILGPSHPDIARSLGILAEIERRQGRLAEAEAGLREALAMRRRLALAPSRDDAEAWSSLAVVLRERANPAGAEAAWRTSYEVYGRVFGQTSPKQVGALLGLALALQDRGDLAGAERLVRQGLALCEKAYGPEHPQVAAALVRLAEVLRKEERWPDAEAAYRRIVAQRRRSLSADDPDLGLSLLGLGIVLAAQEKVAAGEPVLAEALALFRRALPPGHRFIALAEGELGDCYARQGRRSEARPLLESSYRGLLAARGPDHPQTRQARARLDRFGLSPG